MVSVKFSNTVELLRKRYATFEFRANQSCQSKVDWLQPHVVIVHWHLVDLKFHLSTRANRNNCPHCRYLDCLHRWCVYSVTHLYDQPSTPSPLYRLELKFKFSVDERWVFIGEQQQKNWVFFDVKAKIVVGAIGWVNVFIVLSLPLPNLINKRGRLFAGET